ncbi:MAG: hypothetical protein WC483_07040 [Candidatus Paceibacterota bacterium]
MSTTTTEKVICTTQDILDNVFADPDAVDHALFDMMRKEDGDIHVARLCRYIYNGRGMDFITGKRLSGDHAAISPAVLAFAFLRDEPEEVRAVLSKSDSNVVERFLHAWMREGSERYYTIFTLDKRNAMRALLESDAVTVDMLPPVFHLLRYVPCYAVSAYHEDILLACRCIRRRFDRHNALVSLLPGPAGSRRRRQHVVERKVSPSPSPPAAAASDARSLTPSPPPLASSPSLAIVDARQQHYYYIIRYPMIWNDVEKMKVHSIYCYRVERGVEGIFLEQRLVNETWHTILVGHVPRLNGLVAPQSSMRLDEAVPVTVGQHRDLLSASIARGLRGMSSRSPSP